MEIRLKEKRIGIIGAGIVGVMCAKTVAMVYETPFVAVNHLEGHALTSRLTDNINFPYLLLFWFLLYQFPLEGTLEQY